MTWIIETPDGRVLEVDGDDLTVTDTGALVITTAAGPILAIAPRQWNLVRQGELKLLYHRYDTPPVQPPKKDFTLPFAPINPE